MRISEHIIYLDLKKDEKNSLVIHGITGAFDILSKDTCLKLKSRDIMNFSEEELQFLKKRGYITTLTAEEELQYRNKIISVINKATNGNVSITILPTYDCNFRCEYCFENMIFSKGKDYLSHTISKEIIDSVFNQIEIYQKEGKTVSGIHLFGGEPLLSKNKDVVEYIAKKANDVGVPIQCISNGYDMDEYIAIIKKYNFQSVQVTVDGIEETHDKRRYGVGKKPTYKKIMDNIELALKNDISITARTNVNKGNIAQINLLIEEYKKKGWLEIPNFRYYFKSTIKCYEKNEENSIAEPHLMKEIKSIHNGSPDKFLYNSIYGSLAIKIKSMLENNSFAPLTSVYCGANAGMYSVDPFGYIYPCWDVLSEKDAIIGHVDTDSKMFHLNNVHNKWKERTVDKIEDCKNCNYMMFCGGGCAAQAEVMNKDINKVYCDYFTEIFDEVAVDVVEQYLQGS